jgi:hypothetical protein
LFYSKKIPALLITLFTCIGAFSQKPHFSLATDVSILRSFKKDQRYWSIGQTVRFDFHFTPKDQAYAWISYYSDGKFSNALAASAKSQTTVPQQINYKNKAELRFKHISLGWKRYLKGTYNSEKEWNLYGYAGFGLMMGRILNTHSVAIDSGVYYIPVRSGQAEFKRLTWDLGLGVEFPAGGDIYIYFEGRALVPASDYPSQYLLINNKAPFTGAANLGLRILFE